MNRKKLSLTKRIGLIAVGTVGLAIGWVSLCTTNGILGKSFTEQAAKLMASGIIGK